MSGARVTSRDWEVVQRCRIRLRLQGPPSSPPISWNYRSRSSKPSRSSPACRNCPSTNSRGRTSSGLCSAWYARTPTSCTARGMVDPGQAQDGIDVYGRLSGGGHICWQAKNRRDVRASDIENAVDDFLKGRWAASAERFVFCVRATLADTDLQHTIEAQAERLRVQGIVFEGVDGTQLSEKLRPHPDIVDDFFRRSWLVAFAGEEAADSLKGRLEVQRVIALRRRLAEIYDARSQQLDPGLNVDPARWDTRDIRKRFVVPHVDPVNPFHVPFLEPQDWPTGVHEQDEDAWQFDEYNDPVKPADFGRRPSEPSETPSVAFGDWLLQGERTLLLSGAPGSGKSTVLRCLALDLARMPELFPSVHDRLGARIPLLIPFALWSRLTAKEERAVGLPEVVRATFRAHLRQSEVDEAFVDALTDERLVLLIDGLDEYGDEQAARTTLDTLETFVRTHDVFTIATARPAGLRRLGELSRYWKTARLVELQHRQQLEFRNQAPERRRWSDTSRRASGRPVLPATGAQRSAAVARRQSVATPRDAHGGGPPESSCRTRGSSYFRNSSRFSSRYTPNRRATAAAEVKSRSRVFSTDDVRTDALAKLAFEVQERGADGRNRSQGMLVGSSTISWLIRDDGPGWSKTQARLGARELTDIDADTSGLLVERGPDELAFLPCCVSRTPRRAGARHLDARRPSQIRVRPRGRTAMARRHSCAAAVAEAQDRRRGGTWRDTRQAGGGARLDRFGGCCSPRARSQRRLSRGRSAGGQRSRVWTASRRGTDDAERLELLGLALDGPRAGPHR